MRRCFRTENDRLSSTNPVWALVWLEALSFRLYRLAALL